MFFTENTNLNVQASYQVFNFNPISLIVATYSILYMYEMYQELYSMYKVCSKPEDQNYIKMGSKKVLGPKP